MAWRRATNRLPMRRSRSLNPEAVLFSSVGEEVGAGVVAGGIDVVLRLDNTLPMMPDRRY